MRENTYFCEATARRRIHFPARLLARARESSYSCVVTLALFASTASASTSLYDRIGGGAKLESIVDAYVQVLSTDPRTLRSFQKTDLKRIKRVLTEQLCDLTGGPCKYNGDSMHDVHAGQHIDDSEFLSGVELLRDVLINKGVAIRERNELLALLAPMKHDVVQR